MKEQADSINQIIESGIKETDFEKVRNAITQAHKMAIVATNMNKTADAVAKAGQIAKMLVAEGAKAKAMIEFAEQIETVITEIESQKNVIKGAKRKLKKKFDLKFKTKEVWISAFGEMDDREIFELALDKEKFWQLVVGFCKRKSDEIDAYLSEGESKKQQSQQNELGEAFFTTVQKVLESSQQWDGIKFTGNSTDVKALYNVLKAKKLIEGAYPEKRFAEFFSKYFKFSITGRTLQNPANKGQREKETEYRKLLT